VAGTPEDGHRRSLPHGDSNTQWRSGW
jgi:hypothetical protein